MSRPESTRAILRRMLEQPRNPRIVRAEDAPERRVWCGGEIQPGTCVFTFAGRPLHDGGEGVRECRREFDAFIA